MMQEIFVPVIESTITHLYKVSCAKRNDGDLRFNSHNISSADEGSGLELLFEKFETFFREEIEAEISIKDNDDTQKDFNDFSESTQSITLGLLCDAYRFTHNLSYKEKWKSITITGDVKITDGDKNEAGISCVSEIETKFRAVCKYADEHPIDILENKKHLFLYVGKHEAELQDHDSIEVLYFSEKNTFQEISAEIFDSAFTEEQTNFLKNAIVGNRSFIETETYRKLKKEYNGDKCKGFLLEGMGDTGKSITAFAFCQYLMSAEKIYAPIWITVKNDDEIKKIINDDKKDINLPSDRNLNNSRKNINIDSLQLGNPGIRDISVKHAKSKTLVGYFMERIKKILTDTLDNFDSVKIREEFIKHEYMIVIDNLEQNIENKVLAAIYDIFKNIGRQIPLIVTSRSTKADSILLEKLCIMKRKMEPFSKENVRFLVIASAKNSDISYKFKVSPEKFNKYIDALFDSFKEMPSLISITVPFLKGDTIDNQIEKISRLEGYEIQEKINDVFSHTLAKLDLFSQIVLYALIKSDISGETPSPQNICEMILEKIFENKQLAAEENVNYSFGELDTQNIIQRNEKNEYILKHVALTYYVFAETLGIGVKNARDIFLTPAEKLKIAIKFERVEDVKNLLEEYKDDVEKLQLEANLSYAAGSCENVEVVEELIEGLHKNGKNLNFTDKNGNTPLIIAIANNFNIQILKLLISKGADVSLTSNDKRTLLHHSAYNQNIEIMKYLFDNNLSGDINATDIDGFTPLMGAISNNPNIEIVKFLISQGADTTLLDNARRTLLHHSTFNQNVEIIKYLFEQDFVDDIDIIDIDGKTPLMLATAWNQNIEIVKFLISKGANMSLIGDDKRTLLHHSTFNQNSEIMKYLFDKGFASNINVIDTYGCTPLMLAIVWNQNIEIAKFIISQGADTTLVDNDKRTLLHHAAFNQNPEIMKYLFDKELVDNIDVTDIDSYTPLMCAISNNPNIEVIKLLISKGTDTSLVDKDKRTLLHHAAFNQNPEIMKYLFDKGFASNINVIDTYGCTPLMCAVSNNSNIEVIELLISKGADTSLVDNDKRELLHRGAFNQNSAMMKYLFDKGFASNINIIDTYGCTPLMLAIVWNQNVEVVNLLVSKGADMTLVDKDKRTLLHHAAFNQNPEIMKYLFDKGFASNINVIDTYGCTPLMCAVSNNPNIEVIKLLISKGTDTSLVDKDKRALLHRGAFNQNPEIMKYLFDKELVDNINIIDADGCTALMIATVWNQNVEVVNLLVSKGADTTLVRNDKRTLLHYSVYNKNIDVMQYLFDNNLAGDINAKAKDGNTPLHYAVQNENPAIYALLLKNGAKENIKNKERRTAISYASEEFMQKVAKFFEK